MPTPESSDALWSCGQIQCEHQNRVNGTHAAVLVSTWSVCNMSSSSVMQDNQLPRRVTNDAYLETCLTLQVNRCIDFRTVLNFTTEDTENIF